MLVQRLSVSPVKTWMEPQVRLHYGIQTPRYPSIVCR